MTTGLGGKAMTWDAGNRVKTAKLGGVTTTYVYGADGARLKRTVGGSTTLTVGPIEVRGYGSGSETLLLYPQPEFRLTGGQAAYLHRDQVGSIQLVTDAAGADGGTVRNFVCGRMDEHHPAMARVKRSPKMTATWALAIAPLRGGIFHSLSERFKTRNRNFKAASSVGKCPRALTARRSLEFSASIALVV